MDMGKDLVAASATPLVLAILAEGDSYGYAIIKRVAELSGGHLQWTDGMLYPVLHRLERQGHVAAKWAASENGRRRKYLPDYEGRPGASRRPAGAVEGRRRHAAGNLDAGMHSMTTIPDQPIEDQIEQWRTYLRRRQAVHGPDVEELEGHLRDQLAALTEAGLAADEAFLVAVKRMGNLDALSREFARAHSERLWKQLVVAPDVDVPASTSRTELFVVLSLAVAAGLAVKLPALFGLPLSPDNEVPSFYFRNASLFVFPLLTIYFTWKRGLNVASGLWIAVPFAAAAVFANVFPFHNREQLDNFPTGSDTQLLTVLHLPIALWVMAVGVAYVGGRWFSSGRRMDFVRFSGELAIYYVLIALGGGVVTAFTAMLFNAIDMRPWLVHRRLAHPVRGGRGRHHRILAGGSEAKRHREHGAGADQAVHAAVHDSAPRVSGDDGVDRQPDQRETGDPDRLRSAAGRRRRTCALRRLRARRRRRRPISSTPSNCCS